MFLKEEIHRESSSKSGNRLLNVEASKRAIFDHSRLAVLSNQVRVNTDIFSGGQMGHVPFNFGQEGNLKLG